MTRVLVVHHDADYADLEVEALRRSGYEVEECFGPTGAARPCPVLKGHPCQLADAADVLVYDVWVAGATAESRTLVDKLREQYPYKPIVLTSPGLEPDWVEDEETMQVVTLHEIPSKTRLQETIERALRHSRSPALL